MPEIKKNFTKGKMNKDLDERLVPNGEYRHAMNIEVGTSDDSNVGTIQNISGNEIILDAKQGELVGYDQGYSCVGSISDEKTNSIYWFITEGFLDLWVEGSSSLISVEQAPDFDGDGYHPSVDYYNFGSLGLGFGTPWIWTLLRTQDFWYDKTQQDKILRYHHPTSDESLNPSVEPVVVDDAGVIFTIVGQDVDNATNANTILLSQQQVAQTFFDPIASDGVYPQASLTSEIGNAVVNETGYNFSEVDLFELYDVRKIKVGSQIKGWGVHPNSQLPHNFYPEDMIVTEVIPSGSIWIDTDGVKRHQGLIKANYGFYTHWLPNPPNQAPNPEYFLPHLVTHMEFSSGVLKFKKDRLITGINIIDDMLFWTDGVTEPKKINIKRSVQGTEPTGDQNTVIVNTSRNYGLDSDGLEDYNIEEGNITVIKKGPTDAPDMELQTETLTPAEGGSNIQFQINGEMASSGDTFNLLFTSGSQQEDSFNNGTLLSVFDPNNPLDELAVLEIMEINPSNVNYWTITSSTYNTLSIVTLSPLNSSWSSQDANFPSDKIFSVRIQSISSTVSGAAIDYSLKVKEEENLLFNFKFPRFATRWRYEDGEYSTFSPFTRIAFVPGPFSFHPREAYNLGMVNKVSKVILKNLAPSNLPKDVVEIDILYKNEDSPIIYSLQTIRHDDTPIQGETKNIWKKNGNRGLLEITAENITYALPENQLLRPYDNVPRNAKSQEVVGSRLVYGNYLENYNVKANKYNISTGLVSYIENISTPLFQKDSVKSLRQYQLGVVFMDEYGRQTPIISNNNAQVTVGQAKSDKINQITASIKSSAPDWAKYFKFYVKENNFGNNNDYYNLALDRAYDAEDGNIWLSFPSSDRNKVTEESFLIMKKQHGTANPNYDNTRYKIIAIENEAPEFIKYKWSVFGSSAQTLSGQSIFSSAIQSAGLVPAEGYPTIAINTVAWEISVSNPDFEEMLPFVGNGDLAIRFAGLASLVSSQYVIRTASSEDISGQTAIVFTLDKIIQDPDAWVFNPNLANTTGYDADGFPSDLDIIVYKRELKEYPEFDGRFFAKITNNSIVSEFVSAALGVQSKRVVGASAELRWLADELGENNGVAVGAGNSTTGYETSSYNSPDWEVSEVNGAPSAKFKDNFNVGVSGKPTSFWFIDSMTFRARVRADSGSDYEHLQQATPPWQTGGTQFNSTNAGQPIGSPGNGIGIRPLSGGSAVMHLGFGIVEPDGSSWTWNKGDYGTEFRIGESANPAHEIESRIVSRLVKGQEFQFAEDITPGGVNPYYKIIQPVTKLNVFNHTRWSDIKPLLWKNNPVQIGSGQPDYIWIWEFSWADISFFAAFGDETCSYDGVSQGVWDCMKKKAKAGRQALEGNHNRRVIYEVHINAMPGVGHTFATSDWANPFETTMIADTVPTDVADKDNTVTIQFLDEFQEGGTVLQSMNPAIFETEPLKSPDIDIYYEASKAYPTRLTGSTIGNIININDTITSVSTPNLFSAGTKVLRVYFETDFNSAYFNTPVVVLDQDTTYNHFFTETFRFTNPNTGAFVELKMGSFSLLQDTVGYHFGIEQYENSAKDMVFGLDWYNCYSFGNGVESNRIRDDFNQIIISNGVKVSSISDQDQYKEDKKGNSLIFSGLYNSTGGVNNLNQFIQAEKITKDLNPIYGSIQKLHGRETDLIALCEDRVLKILANKDAVFNADGNPQLTANERVLGQSIPFSGEYGISKNPESFASDAYRSYFSDKQRSVILRLSRDGLTPISEHGMSDWFNDNLKSGDHILGSYDIKKREYNITIKDFPTPNIGEITGETGCMDSYAANYDPLATMLGPCEWPDIIAGCVDNPETSTVGNQENGMDTGNLGPFDYDPNANTDCNGVFFWEQNPLDPNDLSNVDLSCCCYKSGCMDPCAVNFDVSACYPANDTCTAPFTPFCNPTQAQIDNYAPNEYEDAAGNTITVSTNTGPGLGCVEGCTQNFNLFV